MNIKLLASLAIVLGVFLFAEMASASTTDVLQPSQGGLIPAGATTNMESLRVGVAGQGGVTFFNGTVLNEGTDPFTIGDDMRIDGEIWRTEKGGANPLKISDSVIPTLTNMNDFGSEDNRWRTIYSGGTRTQNSIVGSISFWSDPFNVNSIKRGHIMQNSDGLYINSQVHNGKVMITAVNGVEIGPRLKLSNITYQPIPDCDQTKEGEIYYNPSVKHFYGCTDNAWKQFDN